MRDGMDLKPGQKVVHTAQPGWGVGEILRVDEDHPPRLLVRWAGQQQPVLVSARDPALRRHRFPAGATALYRGQKVRIAGDGPLGRYRAMDENGAALSLREQDLVALPPKADPLDRLAEGRWGDVASFELRGEALALDRERRAEALAALFGSRVLVLPHQVSVVQRVLAAREPRFVLADEVGLGKTIEAGLVFAALHQAGLVKRCLVLAPAHLTLQWLAELFHKFNRLFTLLDAERYNAAREDDPEQSPWAQFPLVVASHELVRGESHAEEAAAAGFDLVIVDEAHHLTGEKLHDAVQAIARRSWGALLLTATPLQLGAREYFRLLKLVDPASAETEREFERRLAAQGKLAGELRALLEGDASAAARVKAAFPDDAELQALNGDPLLAHLAENYSLSARLIRNRRASVGGFHERRLRVVDVPPAPAERALEADVTSALRRANAAGTLPSGAPLAGLLRRIGSSPESLAAALDARPERELNALAARARALGGGAKLDAFLALLKTLGKEKVLVFAEARETIEALRTRLAGAGVEALAYHGDLSALDRDRAVARFRDPDGPRLLLSTELGGEGRNFQFCHVLVHYDLAWSPAAIEQRIGRLDRVGQLAPIDLYVLREPGSLSEHVLTLLASAVRVFEETVGGLDPVLEQVEPELCRLALDGGGWDDYAAALATRVREARDEVKRSYDPLLDRRSFDRAAVRELAEHAAARLGVGRLPDELGPALRAVADEVEDRCERATLAAAHRVGLGADDDVDVHEGQVAFNVGAELKVDALAGFDLSQERVVLGTFRREVAVQAEELDYFATGHPLVDALLAWVRDGDLGRAAVARASRLGSGAAMLARYAPRLPEPADLAAGARVPSRRAERYLDVDGFAIAVRLEPSGARVDQALGDALAAALLDDLPAPNRTTPEPFRAALDALSRAADAEALRRFQSARADALERLAADRDAAAARLARNLAHAGARPARIAELVAAEKAPYDEAAAALLAASLELDAAAVVQLG